MFCESLAAKSPYIVILELYISLYKYFSIVSSFSVIMTRLTIHWVPMNIFFDSESDPCKSKPNLIYSASNCTL